MNFDKWLRNLADEMSEKCVEENIKPKKEPGLYYGDIHLKGYDIPDFEVVPVDVRPEELTFDEFRSKYITQLCEYPKEDRKHLYEGTWNEDLTEQNRQAWIRHLEDKHSVGDLHRVEHEQIGTFMFNSFNNGEIWQIDSLDSTYATLVRVE